MVIKNSRTIQKYPINPYHYLFLQTLHIHNLGLQLTILSF